MTRTQIGMTGLYLLPLALALSASAQDQAAQDAAAREAAAREAAAQASAAQIAAERVAAAREKVAQERAAQAALAQTLPGKLGWDLLSSSVPPLPALAKETATVVVLREMHEAGLTAADIESALPHLRKLRDSDERLQNEAKRVLQEERRALLSAKPGESVPTASGERLRQLRLDAAKEEQSTWEALAKEVGPAKTRMFARWVRREGAGASRWTPFRFGGFDDFQRPGAFTFKNLPTFQKLDEFRSLGRKAQEAEERAKLKEDKTLDKLKDEKAAEKLKEEKAAQKLKEEKTAQKLKESRALEALRDTANPFRAEGQFKGLTSSALLASRGFSSASQALSLSELIDLLNEKLRAMKSK